jgi:hypothetical protein
MQRSSPPPPLTTIAIDDKNSTKNSAISTYLIAMYDDNYNTHSAVATMVDPCHLSKYDLGLPFGLLLADGFFRSSAYVPVCYPPRNSMDNTCATFFSAPLQFLLDMMSNDDCQAELDRWIPKQELNDAFRMYLHDELFSIVVVQWWRNKIAATHQRIFVSNVRVWIIVSSGIILPAIEAAIAAGMRTIQIGVEEGMVYFGGIIWYQRLQVMIGVIIAAYCCVVQWLVHAMQDNARRRDRHQHNNNAKAKLWPEENRTSATRCCRTTTTILATTPLRR